jgi:hypothetical protein
MGSICMASVGILLLKNNLGSLSNGMVSASSVGTYQIKPHFSILLLFSQKEPIS